MLSELAVLDIILIWQIGKVLTILEYRVIARCHSLEELFHRSYKKMQYLRQKQEELDLPQHKIVGDVVTRWGSTYDMITRILEQQQAISSVLAEDRKKLAYRC